MLNAARRYPVVNSASLTAQQLYSRSTILLAGRVAHTGQRTLG